MPHCPQLKVRVVVIKFGYCNYVLRKDAPLTLPACHLLRDAMAVKLYPPGYGSKKLWLNLLKKIVQTFHAVTNRYADWSRYLVTWTLLHFQYDHMVL